ncbi:hypothetical protein GCM10010182_63080 [Actinomadura cremea]|nr:hypothetical protein GCM10010182_63080 [Actinomadura cremea]
MGGSVICLRPQDDRRWVHRTGSGDIQEGRKKEHLMSVRSVLVVVVATLVGWSGLAAPAVAHASVQPVAASAYDMSAGRVGAIVAALLGLTGVVIGGRALARTAGRRGDGSGRTGAVVALVAGSTGIIIGGLVAVTADGGLGTGNGLGGALMALLVGSIGTTLGGLALARARRTD